MSHFDILMDNIVIFLTRGEIMSNNSDIKWS